MSEELLQEETTMADLEEHFDDANPWNVVQSYMENKTILPVKVEGIVNGGAIAMVEGLRGFIPASKLSLSYCIPAIFIGPQGPCLCTPSYGKLRRQAHQAE